MMGCMDKKAYLMRIKCTNFALTCLSIIKLHALYMHFFSRHFVHRLLSQAQVFYRSQSSSFWAFPPPLLSWWSIARTVCTAAASESHTCTNTRQTIRTEHLTSVLLSSTTVLPCFWRCTMIISCFCYLYHDNTMFFWHELW